MTSAQAAINVLIVSDEDDYIQFSHRLGQQYNVMHVEEGRKAVDTAARGSVDVLVTTQSLPDMTGAELIVNLAKSHDMPAIIIRDQMGHAADGVLEALSSVVSVEQLSRPVGEFTLKKAIDDARERLT